MEMLGVNMDGFDHELNFENDTALL